jgi:glycosyltransferase involved in cell wall biosynthesis
MKTISVVIPSKNEREAIQNVIRAIPIQTLKTMGYTTDITVIDGSDDGTGLLATEAGATVVSEPQQGYGRAYKTGFRQVNGDIIVTLDADMTYPVEEIPNLITLLEGSDIDFLTTNRFGYKNRQGVSPLHLFGNSVLNFTINILFGLKYNDSQSGMWVFKRSLLEQLKLRSDTMAFSEELKIEVGYFLRAKWKEVPIRYGTRVGKTKLKTWNDGLGNLFFIFRKRIKR